MPPQGDLLCGRGVTLTYISEVHPSGKQIQEVNAHSINEGWHIAGQISCYNSQRRGLCYSHHVWLLWLSRDRVVMMSQGCTEMAFGLTGHRTGTPNVVPVSSAFSCDEFVSLWLFQTDAHTGVEASLSSAWLGLAWLGEQPKASTACLPWGPLPFVKERCKANPGFIVLTVQLS